LIGQAKLNSTIHFHDEGTSVRMRELIARPAEKRPGREFLFSSLLFYVEEKRPPFVESSDSDNRKLVSNVVSEITKKSIEYEPES